MDLFGIFKSTNQKNKEAQCQIAFDECKNKPDEVETVDPKLLPVDDEYRRGGRRKSKSNRRRKSKSNRRRKSRRSRK
jgi:hypothetical protein